MAVSITGVTLSYYADTPPGASIVLLAIAVFLLASVAAALLRRRTARSDRADPPNTVGRTGLGARSGLSQ